MYMCTVTLALNGIRTPTNKDLGLAVLNITLHYTIKAVTNTGGT